GTFHFTNDYVVGPGSAAAVVAGRATLHFTTNYVLRPGRAAAIAGMRYADAHLAQPAAAAGLRQLKALFDTIDPPPIKIARRQPALPTAEKQPRPAQVALSPEPLGRVAALEPIPLPELTPPQPAAPELAMTAPPPLRPAVVDRTGRPGASQPP